MDLSDYVEYIKSKGGTTLPELQTAFSLSYKEARAVVSELEKRKIICFKEGITYAYCEKNEIGGEPDIAEIKLPSDFTVTVSRYAFLAGLRRAIDEAEPLYEKVVEYCIRVERASITEIQRKFKIGYVRAGKIVDWMIENGIATEGADRKVTVSINEYLFTLSPAFNKFGKK